MTQWNAPYAEMGGLAGSKVYDEFGTWTIEQDEDGNPLAVQGSCEVLLLDPSDFARFGIEMAA